MLKGVFKNIPRNVIVVALVALFSGLGQDMIAPVLPAYFLALGFDRALIGLIDGLLQGITHIFKFISGVISDRLNSRKGLVFLGYALSSVARPLLSLTSAFSGIAGARILDGIGKGIKDAPRDTLIAASASETSTGRAFGFHRSLDTAGSVIGPVLAAALLFYFGGTLAGYKTIFALTAIPGIIILLLIIFGIHESRTLSREKVRSYSHLFRFPAFFWIFVSATFIAMLTKTNDSLVLVRATDFGISRNWLPLLFAYFTLIYALLSYPIGILSDKYGKLPFITSGWALLALVHLGFIFQGGAITIVLFYTLYGLFFALTEGSSRALIADLVPPESRGSAYAIFNTAIGLAVIAGGFILGKIWDRLGAATSFTISTIGSLLGLTLFMILLIKIKKLSPTREFTNNQESN